MAVLFREYELLASSGLFDAEYYVRNNPDVAELNVDPVLHYLEFGGGKVLNPSANFDSAYYLEQCRRKGEDPANPLLHYITSGAAQGFKPVRTSDAVEAVAPQDSAGGFALCIDRAALIRGSGGRIRLAIDGWAVAEKAVARISATCNGQALGAAALGLERVDVARAYPGNPLARQSGFSLLAEFKAPGGDEPLQVDFLLTTDDGVEHRRGLLVQIDPTAVPDADEALTPILRARIESELAPLRMQVDEAIVDEAGILTVSGWAVCCLDVASIDVSIDDEPIGAADYGRTREDVALAHKEYPGALRSGFSFSADLKRFGPGERTVKVTAVAQSGIRRHALIQVSIPEVGAKPADSRFYFHCDAISLSTAGGVYVKGWLIGGSTTESLTVLLDGEEIGRALIGQERADVAEAYPDISYARNSGFLFRRPQGPALAAGEHRIVLRARDAAGAQCDIPLPVHADEAAQASAQDRESAAPLGVAAGAGEEIKLVLDAPNISNGVADTPIIGSLSIGGWVLANAGIAAVSIAIDERPVANAQHGMRRDDVAKAFPDRPDALRSGFAALIPHWLLRKGTHSVTLSVSDTTGRMASIQFRIEVEDIPEGEGPWTLRRKISQAEIDLCLAMLAGIRWRPWFSVLLKTDGDNESLPGLRRTLASLHDQAYPHWEVLLVPRTRRAFRKAWRAELLAGWEDVQPRVTFGTADSALDFGRSAQRRAGPWDAVLCMPLCGGDELGCDALLELAIASGQKRDGEVFYSDERCVSPATNTAQAYFKPGWSPDLLLSTNYVGRSWCANSTALLRAGLSVRDWLEHGDYDFILRTTEAATGIGHVPKVLLARSDSLGDTEVLERRALAGALARRKIRGAVKPGCSRGIYRVKPKKTQYGRVSIIIPTRASRGLIKTCLDTLKAKTAYRDYEIVCIENIPADQHDWKSWLRQNADKVLETDEPFNWSRYNNLCVQQATGRHLLFLNDDVEVLEPDWLDTMLHIAARPDVGIVGPQLLYPDRTVQHAGLALTDIQGRARHVFRHGREDDPGYFGLALTQRNVIAVTGACMLMRRDTFDALGGFDESYTVINNDLDFCLRAWKRGLLIVYTPHTRLIHHEMISRGELGDAFDSAAFSTAWRDVFVEGDPYLNRNISRGSDNMVPEREPVTTICTGHPLFARSSIRRILVLKLDHIGDCIIALPAIRKLKRHFPAASITVLSAGATRLVWSMEPAVDKVLEFNFFHARSQLGLVGVSERELEELGEQLRPLRFDLAVDLRKSLETRQVLKHTGAKYLAGYDYQGHCSWLDVALQWEGDPSRLVKRQSAADDLVSLVDAVGASCDNERKPLSRPANPLDTLTAEEVRGLSDLPLVCIHAGAGNELKAWPPSSFCELIDLLVEREGVQVAMVGGPAEAALSDTVIAGVRDPARIRNLAGKLSLGAIPDLFLRARLFIGNDSGPKHIAAALGVPTVGIHSGNIDAREWGPVGPNAAAIWRRTICSPCYIDKAPDCPRNLVCLKGIGAGDVYRLCRQMLQIGAPDRGVAENAQAPNKRRRVPAQQAVQKNHEYPRGL